jgi:hypothetical protein
MERSLSKIRDVDLKILSELEDIDILNYCKTHKYGKELCDNENFWENRVETKFPKAAQIKSPNRTWKNFYMKIVYYLDKYKSMGKAMLEAVTRNESDMIEFLIIKGASNLSDGMKYASNTGNQRLVDFFIEKAEEDGEEWDQYDWDIGLFWSAQGGHIDLMKFFIAKGADQLNSAMYAAAAGGHKDAIDYLISQGANNWSEGLRGAKQSRNEELISFFGNKLI